jgi:hypothetical protein
MTKPMHAGNAAKNRLILGIQELRNITELTKIMTYLAWAV